MSEGGRSIAPLLDPLAGVPGVLFVGQLDDVLGQLAGGYVGDGDMIEDLAQVGAQRDPDLLEHLGGAAVFDLLGALPAPPAHRPLDGPDARSERDLIGGWGKPVAPLGPALAAHDPG